MVTFRILHASDLHFYHRDKMVSPTDYANDVLNGGPIDQSIGFISSYDSFLATALAQFAYLNREGFDAIVLSGDLATTGEQAGLQLVHDFVSAQASNGYLTPGSSPTLAAAGKPIAQIPGNHDRFKNLLCAPGDVRFDKVFGKLWGAGQGAQTLADFTRGDVGLAIIGADFSLQQGDNGDQAFYGHFGRGRATKPVVDKLVTLTSNYRERHPDCVVLWVCHFDPLAAEHELALLDADVLSNAIREAHPAAILCGHTHSVNERKTFEGCPVFVCGTTTQWYAPSGNHLQVIDINVDPTRPENPQLNARKFTYQRQASYVGFFESVSTA
jgi:predicted phosphodiesterase